MVVGTVQGILGTALSVVERWLHLAEFAEVELEAGAVVSFAL